MRTPDRVVASISNATDDHCVDIFVREDGSFGFEEFRRDPEDLSGWFSLHRYNLQTFATQDDALRQARLSIAWMAELPRRGP